jgi:hypothetical protein
MLNVYLEDKCNNGSVAMLLTMVFVSAASSSSVVVEGLVLLSSCYCLLHDHDSALEVAKKGLQLCSNSLYFHAVTLELQ